MACGCLVIGYTGGGGDEFFDPEYCYPICAGDLECFVKTIEEVLCRNSDDPGRLDRKRQLASQVICQRYSREQSKKSIVAAFRQLLEKSRT